MGENGDRVLSKSGSDCDSDELEEAADNNDGDDVCLAGSVGVPGRDGHDNMAPTSRVMRIGTRARRRKQGEVDPYA